MPEIKISLGALAPLLKDQLKGHGLSRTCIEQMQKDADAITRLNVRSILSETATKNARRKLGNAILNTIRKQ